MDEKELNFILQEGEGLKIEFKETLDKSLSKEMVAFANSSGGRIFLGIDDKNGVKGIKITNELKSQIQDTARNCDPEIKISLEEFDRVLIIDVKEGKDKPYKCSSGFYLRQGPNSQKMTREEILDLIMTVNKKTFDSLIDNEFNFKKDFDKEKLNNYLERAGLSKSISIEKTLKGLGVISNSKLNNAGVLLFGKDPQKFVSHSVFTCVLFRNKEGSQVIDRKEITGSLVEIVEEVMKFVGFYTKVAYKFTGKPQRENIYEYPIEAIREAVINSVMHKNYFEPGHNNILKFFPDRIQTENVWKKPKHFKLGETVFRRNPIIANLFARIHFGEKMGSGFARMKEYCKKENAPFPAIKFTDTHFYIVFEQNPEYLKMAEITPLVTPLVTPLAKLTELEKKVFDEIRENPKISRTEIAAKLNIKLDTVKEYLKKLKKKGILKRVGKTSRGYWEIIERGKREIKNE